MVCEHCEHLIETEKHKIEWSKDLTATNISLLRKLNEQEELIRILKNRLLAKRSSYMTESVQTFMEQMTHLTENYPVESEQLLVKSLKDKLDEITELARLFNSEREIFQKEIDENERFLAEKITYLQEQVEYFRECFFQELEKCNKVKQYFAQKLQQLTTDSHRVVLETLKEKEGILNSELRARYQKTIQKSKEEIERQGLLVSKLRKHNKQLYLQIQKNKVTNEEKVAILQKSIQDLKSSIKQLQEKNEYLHKQIKLEVQGCQTDISDTRKTLKRLMKV